VSELDFLSPSLARSGVYRSPLERALRNAPEGIRDLSRTGKLEVRGELGEAGFPEGAEAIRITATRVLVLCPYEDAPRVRAELDERFLSVVDLTGALAGLELKGLRLLRRLTDLDPANLPATGSVARVPATVLGDGGTFRLFFPQEYADYVAEVVLDTAEGLAA